MNNNNSRNILLSVLGVAILVVAVVGVSFAVFQFTAQGTTTNTLSTASISMTFKEKTTGITIENAMPKTDATGSATLTEGEYFDFSVGASLVGTTTVQYEVTAVKSADSTLKDEHVHLYLEESTDGGTTYGPATGWTANTGKPFTPSTTTLVTAAPNMMALVTDTFSVTDATDAQTPVKHYRLRMWVSEDADLSDYDDAADNTTDTTEDGEHTITSGSNSYKFSVTVLVNAKQVAA